MVKEKDQKCQSLRSYENATSGGSAFERSGRLQFFFHMSAFWTITQFFQISVTTENVLIINISCPFLFKPSFIKKFA